MRNEVNAPKKQVDDARLQDQEFDMDNITELSGYAQRLWEDRGCYNV